MDIKDLLICILIVAILTFCMPNVAVASTGNQSTTFHNSAGYTSDYMPTMGSRTSNGLLNW